MYQTLLAGYSKNRTSYGPAFVLPSDEVIQRMYITYQGNAMIVDFIGIPGRFHPHYGIDSLVIQHGYFKSYCSKKVNKSVIDNNYTTISKLIDNGITFHTTKYLSKKGFIKHKPKVDTSFLLEKNLPSSYFFERAKYYINAGQINKAFTAISKGFEKNGGKRNCNTLFLLSDAYTLIERYDTAIEFISKAISKNCFRSMDFLDKKYEIMDNYRVRSQLYIKNNQLDDALEDYNTIVKLSSYSVSVRNERALFRVHTLKDYNKAIIDLTNIIDSIPEVNLTGCHPSTSRYSQTYFNLGLAEYYSGQIIKASNHWLKAMQCGYHISNFYHNAIIHFDSVIQENQNIPDLYLARAIAYQEVGYNIGREKWKRYLNMALDDLSIAEKLGLKDYRINMYRAISYSELKNYTEALLELDLTISKNEDYPIAYSKRYEIRRRIGQAKYDDNNDSDLVKSQALCKTWKFEK